MPKIHDIGKDYAEQDMARTTLDPNPMQQFKHWFEAAEQAAVPELNAMTLATADAQGHPDARIVLLKEYNDEGFVFYTNYHSQKGQQIDHNSLAALVFWWQPLAKQVRVHGHIEKISAAQSDEYFASRKRESNIGAHASQQSEVIANRQALIDSYQRFEQQFADQDPIPRPAHWGGYLLKPTEVEFWSGCASRLHDRFRYRLSNGDWVIERLAP